MRERRATSHHVILYSRFLKRKKKEGRNEGGKSSIYCCYYHYYSYYFLYYYLAHMIHLRYLTSYQYCIVHKLVSYLGKSSRVMTRDDDTEHSRWLFIFSFLFFILFLVPSLFYTLTCTTSECFTTVVLIYSEISAFCCLDFGTGSVLVPLSHHGHSCGPVR